MLKNARSLFVLTPISEVEPNRVFCARIRRIALIPGSSIEASVFDKGGKVPVMSPGRATNHEVATNDRS